MKIKCTYLCSAIFLIVCVVQGTAQDEKKNEWDRSMEEFRTNIERLMPEGDWFLFDTTFSWSDSSAIENPLQSFGKLDLFNSKEIPDILGEMQDMLKEFNGQDGTMQHFWQEWNTNVDSLWNNRSDWFIEEGEPKALPSKPTEKKRKTYTL